MSTGGYWWHATGVGVGDAVNATPTPATVAAIGNTPTATRFANAQTLPEAPSVLAHNIEDTLLHLTWSGTAGIIRWDIERNGVIIAVDWPQTTYTDLGLTPQTTYRYRVRPKP